MSPKSEKTTVGVVAEEVLAYTAGRDAELDVALIDADCLGSAAHAWMLSRVPVRPPILSRDEAKTLIRELAKIPAEARAGTFRITLADQDVHLAVERRLTAALGDLGKRIHTARSRNDQVAVDLRLFVKRELQDVVREAAGAADAFRAFAFRHRALPMAGRTHLQPAMPSSVGLWASAWAEGLLDGMALAMTAYDLADRCPLGSAAAYGVPLPIDRQLTSDLLGFARPFDNVLHAAQTRGQLEAQVLFALGQIMLTLSRAAEDLILFAMPEFGYFRLPVEYTTGSSIMPQKRNPDVLELLRAKAAKVMALSSMTAEIMRAAPGGYNRDVQETKEPLLEGLAITRATLRILPGLLAGIAVDRDALRRGFSPGVFATDRALELVAEGVPFRDAYHEVKAHLEALESRSPEEAVAKKTHLGAPMGLDFTRLASRIREAADWAKGERAASDRAAKKLWALGR
ncbi:MAG: argininosuccinate lyase [Kiritimatiellae bacterium]|nr:argininosuccinate lyase [Kiritimatiellia bacterium]